MFKLIKFLLSAPLLFTLFTSADNVQAEDLSTLLKEADNFRLSAESSLVEIKIELFKNDTLDRQRHYSVYIKPGRRSLVLFRHASERGQKVLMLDDKFWTIMPKSKRPIRITPSQKLLGEASSGDIATMTWSEDYSAELIGDTEIAGVPCLHLMLSATRKGVSYKQVELYLDKGDHHPVQAKLYVASGKLAKIADYEMGEMNGQRQVVRMILQDRIQKNRRTEVNYVSVIEKSIPDKYYNPAYLVRNQHDAL